MKTLEIKKTKPTFIISTFKNDIIRVGLVFSFSNFFIAKTFLANNWRSLSCINLALFLFIMDICNSFRVNCKGNYVLDMKRYGRSENCITYGQVNNVFLWCTYLRTFFGSVQKLRNVLPKPIKNVFFMYLSFRHCMVVKLINKTLCYLFSGN